MQFYVVQSVATGLYLGWAAASGELVAAAGDKVVTTTASGLEQYFTFRGVEYTQPGVGNPGRAYLVEFFGGTGADALVLDVPASMVNDRQQLQAWTQDQPIGLNQLWMFSPTQNQTYTIRTVTKVSANLVLDIPAFSRTPGTPLQLWDENGGANQQWNFLGQGGGAYPNTFSVSPLGNIGGGGVKLRLSGSGFEANTFTPYIINGPGWDGSSALPMANGFQAGETFTFDFDYHYEYDSVAPAAPALIVLEDGQNYVSATFFCPQSWFPNSQAG